MKTNKIQIAVVGIPYFVLLTKFVMNHNIKGSIILTVYAVLIYNFISLFRLIDLKEVNFKRIHKKLKSVMKLKNDDCIVKCEQKIPFLQVLLGKEKPYPSTCNVLTAKGEFKILLEVTPKEIIIKHKECIHNH
ncbi:hypothetical protein SIM22_04775 [Bacillus cereus group sp. BfR-BA-01363]|uniref:hypothetical protein n=1 Tax=Bacillus cereus group sp. BfR-BA-01363 TaxID=3094882 RepID=UPI0029C2D115|nr:hypothetical protein [Bacillus cereus group sp. BfR-BA-01363]MDX5853444.1 hypothetical protein [Bacillus cereus group sp. BfR-BA-01363]